MSMHQVVFVCSRFQLFFTLSFTLFLFSFQTTLLQYKLLFHVVKSLLFYLSSSKHKYSIVTVLANFHMNCSICCGAKVYKTLVPNDIQTTLYSTLHLSSRLPLSFSQHLVLLKDSAFVCGVVPLDPSRAQSTC